MKQPQLMHVNSSIYIRSIIVNVDVTKYIYNAPCDDSSVIFVKIKINRMNYFCRKYYKFWQKNHYSQKILDVQCIIFRQPRLDVKYRIVQKPKMYLWHYSKVQCSRNWSKVRCFNNSSQIFSCIKIFTDLRPPQDAAVRPPRTKFIN